MPNIAGIHPIVVHFAIALIVLGVIFRALSLWSRLSWLGPTAAILLIVGTLASVVAAKSGVDAHGPVERVPGARAAVVDHESWGLWARNIAFVVAGLELLGLALRRNPRVRNLHVASAVVGFAALVAVVQAGNLGGRLVYSYAGGVGIRFGDPADVQRLLLAGLYHQSQLDRSAGRADRASALITQAAAFEPSNLELQILAAESQLVDRKSPPAAIDALQMIRIPTDDTRLQIRHGLAMADALEAAGQKDGARALLQSLLASNPTNARLKDRLSKLN